MVATKASSAGLPSLWVREVQRGVQLGLAVIADADLEIRDLRIADGCDVDPAVAVACGGEDQLVRRSGPPFVAQDRLPIGEQNADRLAFHRGVFAAGDVGLAVLDGCLPIRQGCGSQEHRDRTRQGFHG